MSDGVTQKRKLAEVENIRDRLLVALNGSNDSSRTKDAIRGLHEEQRRERAHSEGTLLRTRGEELASFLASGSEIDPHRIRPRLVQVVKPDSLEGSLFRLATLLWSVPVSRGYGRRLRFVVLDEQNSKLMGLIALGDPVFNLACRDAWIGWTVDQRRERLSFTMDAYVLGAVPPYSKLLAGKLLGALVACQEIKDAFRLRYADSTGIISQRKKNPYLALVTTTSALGRSSVYNRLRLPGVVEFTRIGVTNGWGHFLVSNELFRLARQVLRDHGDAYAENYNYGQGPNWRLRALRKVCGQLDIDDELLRHGVRREVYAVPIACNWKELLLQTDHVPNSEGWSSDRIAAAALERWILPRSKRQADWREWNKRDTWVQLTRSLPGSWKWPRDSRSLSE